MANTNLISDIKVGAVIGLAPDQVQRVYADIDAKRRATLYMHLPPLLVEPVEPIKQIIAEAADSAARGPVGT